MKKPSFSDALGEQHMGKTLDLYGDMLTEESTSLALPTVKQVAELLQHHQPLSSEQMEALQSPEFEAKIVQILETYKELVLGLILRRADRGKSIPPEIRFQTPEGIYAYLDQAQSSALEYQKKVWLAESIQEGQAKVVYDDENHGKVWYDPHKKIMGETDLRGVIIGNVLEGYEIVSEGQSDNAEAVIARLNDIFIPVKDAQNIPHMVCGYTGWGSKHFSLRTQPIESMGRTKMGTAWYILSLDEWHKPIFISSAGDDILGTSMSVVDDVYLSKRSESNDYFGKQCIRDIDTNIEIEIPLSNIASADFEGGIIVLKKSETYTDYSHLGNIVVRPSSRRKGTSIFSGKEYFIDLQAFQELCAKKAAKARRKLDFE